MKDVSKALFIWSLKYLDFIYIYIYIYILKFEAAHYFNLLPIYNVTFPHWSNIIWKSYFCAILHPPKFLCASNYKLNKNRMQWFANDLDLYSIKYSTNTRYFMFKLINFIVYSKFTLWMWCLQHRKWEECQRPNLFGNNISQKVLCSSKTTLVSTMVS